MRIAGVEQDGPIFRCAIVEVSWKGSATLLSCQEFPVEKGSGNGAALKEISRADRVIASLPGTSVSSRILTLPFTQPRKLESVLPFEMEPLIPFEIDEVILSWHLLARDAGSSRLLVAATPREPFGRFIENLRQHGIDPHQVEWDVMALFNFFQVIERKTDGALLLMNIGKERSSLCFISEGSPLMIRSIGQGTESLGPGSGWSGDHPLIRELVKTVEAFKDETGKEIRSLLIAGEEGGKTPVSEFVSRELSIPLTGWTVDPEKMKISPECQFDGERVDPRYIPAIGLALKGVPVKGTLSQINFRKGEFSHVAVEAGKRGIQRIVLVFSLVILLLGLGDLGIRYSIKKERYDKAKDQLRKEYLSIFPGSASVVSEVDQARGTLGQLKKREAFFNMNGPLLLDVLREVTVQVPKEVRIDVSEISIGSEKVRLEAETDSFDALEKVKEALGKSPLFGEIAVVDSKMNAEESKVRFKLDITERPGGGGR